MSQKTITINKKEYKPNDLKGQDLFIFMEIADKLDISLKQINKYAGEVEIYEFDDYIKATNQKQLSKKAQKEKYNEYLSGQQGATLGLGIIAFILRSLYKVKKEINDLISKIWEMPLEIVKELSIKEYTLAAHGAIQIESVKEAFKTFFQLSNQKS